MIRSAKYKTLEQETHNYVYNFYHFLIDIYGYKPTPLHEFFKLKDAVAYNEATQSLKFRVGQYQFFIDFEIRLGDTQPAVVIKTYEDVQHVSRKTDYDATKIVYLDGMDIIYDGAAWKLAIKPAAAATNILVLYTQLLAKYIERVELGRG